MGIMLPAYNIFILQPSMLKALIKTTEQDAIRAARHIIRELTPQQPHHLDRPLSRAEEEAIQQLKTDFGLLKVRVFNPQGKIIYSTSIEEIGTVNDNDYFHQKVANGHTLTKVVQKSEASLDGPAVTLDVVETYIPIMAAGSFSGALELYYDITQSKMILQEDIDHSSIFLLMVTAVFLALLSFIGFKGKVTFAKQAAAEQEIRQLAYFDKLTGLPNRTLFQDRLNQALYRARRDNAQIALLYFDLDRFKEINDSLGHQIGDLLLERVAQRLQTLVRHSDTLARIGGDEFVLLLTSLENEHDAVVVADKILAVFISPFELNAQQVFSSPSIGIAIFPDDGQDAETLQKHADIAMYAAKDNGRNAFAFFSAEMTNEALDRRKMGEALRNALKNNELFLVYQPQLNLETGTLVGVEALLRWRHPDKGLISPAQFIPLAEETGLINSIGEWVLRCACQQNKAWQEAGYPSFRVGVNLSAHQMKKPELVNRVDQILEETGLDPCWLELEITESLIMENAAKNNQTLGEFKSRGIHLAIDDFGTGYSSLSYLKNFKVDRIKIDRSFVGQLPKDLDDSAIVETILAMAKALQLEVVAEGVETQEQLDFLKARNCHSVQGFYLGRPMPAEALAEQMMGWGRVS